MDDGSWVSAFRYHGHQVLNPGSSIHDDWMPHFRHSQNSPSIALIITLRDILKDVYIDLQYSVFCEADSIVRSAKFRNSGSVSVRIDEINSALIDFPVAAHDKPYHLTHLSGSWARERQLVSSELRMGLAGIDSRRGASSHQQNPFVVISEGAFSETDNEHFTMGLVYSSSFQIMTEVSQTGMLRVGAGIHPDSFEWMLDPGEVFSAPEAVLTYSKSGMGNLSRKLHDLIRKNLLPNSLQSQWTPSTSRPILVNSWEAMYFNCTDDAIKSELASPAKRMGLDMVVLDDGWFLNRNDDQRALGDWIVDRKKFPNGLDGLSYAILNQDLLFGIWMEPEMISRDSDLYRKHPDWCVHVKGRSRTESRNQLVLDLTRRDVQDFMVESVSRILRESNASYLKWDFNRHLTELGNEILNIEHQGQFLHLWTLGLYKVLYRITSAFPNVLFESCSGGGGRYDPGMMFFSQQIWTSDNTDALSRAKIQYGTSLFYPFNVMASHVSAIPNHQVHRQSTLTTRHIVAMSGMMGYELDLANLSDFDMNESKKFVDWYKKYVEELLLTGKLYRLSSPFTSSSIGTPQLTSWMQVGQNANSAVVFTVLSSYYEVVIKAARIKLQGLDESKRYDVSCIDSHNDQREATLHRIGNFSGKTLMSAGIRFKPWFDGDAAIFLLQST